jgi:hypothetical protein
MSEPQSDIREPVVPAPVEPLDLRWFASDGPTAGYLLRRALEAGEELLGIDFSLVRHVHLQVLKCAAPGPVEITAYVSRGVAATAQARVIFNQEKDDVGVALMTIGAARLGPTEPGDTARLRVQPRTNYPPMKTPSPPLPPVTARFVYRPTRAGDGSVPHPGWDQVWVTPTDPDLRGRALVASILDCWYPPSFIRSINASLRGGEPLDQPPPLVLITAGISFPADDQTYNSVRHAVLASRLTGVVDGYYFEHSQIGSERGELLATAELVRARAIAAPGPHRRATNRR